MTQGLTFGLLQVLKEEKLLRRPHLDLLLNTGIDRLDLSGNPTELTYVLGLVGRTCKNLRQLDLSFCEKINQLVFREIARSIQNITTLNLRSTSCSDAIMAILGGFCPELRDLDVSWCPVSDDGISSLCLNMDDLEGGMPRCQKLCILHVMGTNVTEVGASCAFRHLPYLKIFSFNNTCAALEKLHIKDLEDGHLTSLPSYQLQTLHSDSDAQSYVSPESIHIASVLCPNVSKVAVANANISNNCLLLLSHFKNLKELELGNGSDATLDFKEGIVPLLAVRGAGLTSLSLADVPGVDVAVIGAACPKLRNLDMLFVNHYESLLCDTDAERSAMRTAMRTEHPFQQLKTVKVVCTEKSDIPAHQMRLLLSHSYDIENIYVQRCQTLTDSLISDALNSNPMSHLTALELEYCNTLTAASIMTLLSLDNPLREIKTWWCQGITRRDFDFFKDLVHNENLDLRFEWT